MMTLLILLSILLVVAICVAGALEARGNSWQAVAKRQADLADARQAEIERERTINHRYFQEIVASRELLIRYGYDGPWPVEVSPAAEAGETPALLEPT